ncbi:uncharacterized protein Z518_10165 [Rhinocladiella mackenziei CBS 650.93]|uniref:Uncharacterized protein n=1 Tax=Rhinocladiella mackenziei CBS 650.93 TaxID=1442369 RepID=A0A0D2I5N6_9EURO|nr:uncharacterized protein Z518_10165 [Rhinocladiella mackenziei CBS 650.93]KIX01099.1 hypothetical protein Z518_10165 [Rhinocladiella mackenziei CBS 650.93]
MSKSSSASNTTIPTSPEETSLVKGSEDISPTAGLEDIRPLPFKTILNLRKIVQSQCDELQKGDSTQQYLVFTHVSTDDLTKIDRTLEKMSIHTRMTHYTDENLLIVKFPTAKHEAAHLSLTGKVNRKLALMGIDDEFWPVGATRIHGRRSSKEADSAFKPYSFRPNEADWPTIVFEAGLSESLRRLRLDAKWWLTGSRGDVKTVIVISIKPAQSILHIEKWELASVVAGTRLNTRAFSTLNNPQPSPQVPTQIQVIAIDPNTVTGAPLTLEFAKIFLRPPVPPENDIIFTAQELSTLAARIW